MAHKGDMRCRVYSAGFRLRIIMEKRMEETTEIETDKIWRFMEYRSMLEGDPHKYQRVTPGSHEVTT